MSASRQIFPPKIFFLSFWVSQSKKSPKWSILVQSFTFAFFSKVKKCQESLKWSNLVRYLSRSSNFPKKGYFFDFWVFPSQKMSKKSKTLKTGLIIFFLLLGFSKVEKRQNFKSYQNKWLTSIHLSKISIGPFLSTCSTHIPNFKSIHQGIVELSSRNGGTPGFQTQTHQNKWPTCIPLSQIWTSL